MKKINTNKGDNMKVKLLLVAFFSIFIFQIYQINHENHLYYETKLKEKTERIILGESPKRGRILDVNGKVLVDNKEVYNISYHKNYKATIKDELEIAQKLSSFVDTYSLSTTDLKNYYLALNNNGSDLISKDEKKLYDMHKISGEEISQMKWDRITDEMINYDEENKKTAYLFLKMQNGYSYQDKVLFKNVTKEFIEKINALEISSLFQTISYERTYPYEETLLSIFGSVGNISKEKLTSYLKKGYALSDIVGTSGLEEQYEDILKGEKGEYFINSDNTLTEVKESQSGNDITLNLDIEVQLELEKVMKEEMLKASKRNSAKYFNEAYAMVGNPMTGGIIALTGLKKTNDTFTDITITAFTSSYAMGSVVKGASNTVGYLSGAIEVGKKIKDSCVKLYSEPSKCSYKRLGYVDDITALKTSSNYFQFLTAISSTGQKYRYNMKFNVTEEDFKRYRDTFASYGLGAKTSIDYPLEQTGMKGTKVAGDLLLNLAIGQYDTYTPISLLQYINTLANYGNRYALRFKKEDYNTFLNQIALDEAYYNRITEGLYEVFHGGTASSYVSKNKNAVGKTGTSETFYDSDNDGVVDKEVINSTVAFYYPRESPRYSIVVVAPFLTDDGNFMYPFTKNVSLHMTNYLSM